MSVENDKVVSASTEPAYTSSDVEVMAGKSGEGLQRQMKNRHIAMISIGGVIGTGLFLGTATSLRNGGPIGLVLGFSIVGSFCYTTMISLGEMAAFLPIPGGHITYAERFVDPALSFALGWLYWYSWAILLPTELSAAAVLVNYWNAGVNSAVWVTIFLIVVIIINVLGAGAYGEAEFIFASIKVIAITGLIILGIILDLGGGPTHDRIGFRYWKNPGPFVEFNGIAGAKGQFLGWWAVMTQAAFSFVGTELIAIAGAEAKNPRRNIPKAIKRVYIRIILFYVCGTLVIGLLVPSNDGALTIADGTAAASPFVIAINNAGIKILPSIVNATILTSAWSAANSDMYSSSRAIYSLALHGNAPQVFLKVTRWGLPWVAVMLSALFGFLSYMGVTAGSGKVFGWFVNMTAVAGLASWCGIAVTYIRFHRGLKVHGIDRNTLPYKAPFQPFAAWYAGVGCLVTIIFSGFSVFLKGHWQTDTFITNYLPMIFLPILYIGCKAARRTSVVPYTHMDFQSGLQEVLDASFDEPPPRNWVERVWGNVI